MSKLLALALVICGLAGQARAQSREHPFGLGVQLGDPHAVNLKYWLGSDDALQASVGVRPGYEHHGRYAWRTSSGPLSTFEWTHRFAKIEPRNKKVAFSFHAGVGGGLGWVNSACYYDWPTDYRVCYQDDVVVMARAPIGFSAYFPRPRLEAFVEVVPALRVLPYFNPLLMGTFGGRYYF
jgi:hypothetical protein